MHLFRPLGLVLLALGLAACEPTQQHFQLRGPTMGTSYSIDLVAIERPANGLQAALESRLDDINRQMSTYDPESEISRFNRTQSGEKTPLSDDFIQVLNLSRKFHQWTDGAFEPTLLPLVRLWGFGPDFKAGNLPPEAAIQAAQQRIGFDAVQWDDAALSKSRDGVQLDVSAIAKGYAVDALTELLKDAGYAHFLVEIGGEIRAQGQRADGRLWRVAVQQPDSAQVPERIITLNNQAIATSGDYRNYFVADGQRYAHVIDPRSGYPPHNGVASVSVVANDCASADALATGLMVLGVQEGLKLAESKGLAVHYLLRENNRIVSRSSSQFGQ